MRSFSVSIIAHVFLMAESWLFPSRRAIRAST
ncbi:hypothetical protein H4W33_011006 [Kibdelosporangium phytohabitans]|nr:hypothetical protein [Kibdelosporangium phytohabitans]